MAFQTTQKSYSVAPTAEVGLHVLGRRRMVSPLARPAAQDWRTLAPV